MPPRGVEKGVSQESPHFSFPAVNTNDDGDDYGEYREGSRSRIIDILFPEVDISWRRIVC